MIALFLLLFAAIALWLLRPALLALMLIIVPLVIVRHCWKAGEKGLLALSMLLMAAVVWLDCWLDPINGYFGRFAYRVQDNLHSLVVYPLMFGPAELVGGNFLYSTWYYLFGLDTLYRWFQILYAPQAIVPFVLVVCVLGRLVIYPLFYGTALLYYSPTIRIPTKGRDINEQQVIGQLYRPAKWLPWRIDSRIKIERLQWLTERLRQETSLMDQVKAYKKK
jgi:hypothetical protein